LNTSFSIFDHDKEIVMIFVIVQSITNPISI